MRGYCSHQPFLKNSVHDSGAEGYRSAAIPTREGKPTWHDFVASRCERFLRKCVVLNDRAPRLLFNRITQLLLDSGAAGLALFLAFQLRFDGAVPVRYRS